ncbi:MAG: hypothetical protein JXA03_01460, partial [Bacteroidales bacterium]|nr:hypothetical protein [Bacteroidales bacterium]
MIESCPKNELKILQEGKFNEVDKSDPEKAINILQDRIRFLEEIIDNVNATIYINDILKPESVWANKMAFAMFGATISEMNEGSLSWYKKHYHPDDFEIIAHSTDSLQQDTADKYNGIYRTRKSPDDTWHTHFGSGKVFRK